MIAMAIAVEAIPALENDEARRLAETEYERLLAVVDDLRGDEWSRQTDCPDWDVRDMLGHLLGMFDASPTRRNGCAKSRRRPRSLRGQDACGSMR
jgi:uncharacterized protein (TIGR03083 family)